MLVCSRRSSGSGNGVYTGALGSVPDCGFLLKVFSQLVVKDLTCTSMPYFNWIGLLLMIRIRATKDFQGFSKVNLKINSESDLWFSFLENLQKYWLWSFKVVVSIGVRYWFRYWAGACRYWAGNLSVLNGWSSVLTVSLSAGSLSVQWYWLFQLNRLL